MESILFFIYFWAAFILMLGMIFGIGIYLSRQFSQIYLETVRNIANEEYEKFLEEEWMMNSYFQKA